MSTREEDELDFLEYVALTKLLIITGSSRSASDGVKIRNSNDLGESNMRSKRHTTSFPWRRPESGLDAEDCDVIPEFDCISTGVPISGVNMMHVLLKPSARLSLACSRPPPVKVSR